MNRRSHVYRGLARKSGLEFTVSDVWRDTFFTAEQPTHHWQMLATEKEFTVNDITRHAKYPGRKNAVLHAIVQSPPFPVQIILKPVYLSARFSKPAAAVRLRPMYSAICATDQPCQCCNSSASRCASGSFANASASCSPCSSRSTLMLGDD